MSHSKQITKRQNFHLSSQKIIPKNHTKYLGIIIDEHLTFKKHMAQSKQKLNRTKWSTSKAKAPSLKQLIENNLFCTF